MEKSELSVKEDTRIRRLQELIAYEMKVELKTREMGGDPDEPFEGRFIFDPEIFRIAAYVERNRNELIYLEMFVFEKRYVKQAYESLFDPDSIPVKPTNWSKIRRLAKETFNENYEVPMPLLEQWEKENDLLLNAMREEGGERWIRYRSEIGKVPRGMKNNLVTELYFRGYLEALLWDCHLKKQQEKTAIPANLTDDVPNNHQGFFRDRTLKCSADAFGIYRDKYRQVPSNMRTSGSTFLPKNCGKLTRNLDDKNWYVFTEPELWKNFWAAKGEGYQDKKSQKWVKPIKGRFLDWEKELWAIRCLKGQTGRCISIINYISWQMFLSDNPSSGRNKSDKGDQTMARKPENYLSRLMRKMEDSRQDQLVIDEKTQRLLLEISQGSGYKKLDTSEKEYLRLQIRKSRKIAAAFHYARILENERRFEELLSGESAPSDTSIKTLLARTVARLKKQFAIDGWAGIKGAQVLCSVSASSASGTDGQVQVETVRKNRILAGGKVTKRLEPETGDWHLSGTLRMKQTGNYLLLLFPDGDIITLLLDNREEVRFSGIPVDAELKPGELFFKLIE